MPAESIPTVSSELDCSAVSRHFADARAVRLCLPRAAAFVNKLPQNARLWIDPCVDMLHLEDKLDSTLAEDLAARPHGPKIRSHGMAGECSQAEVDRFVGSLLDDCLSHSPSWITVPQLPLTLPLDNTRRKFNKQLANAASKWRAAAKSRPEFVFPVITCNRDAANLKGTWRDKIVAYAKQGISTTNSKLCWVVNAELNDETGSGPNGVKRLPGLVRLHSELKNSIPGDISFLAGPYWAMNIVLWTRGLIDSPVIAIGTGFQHHIYGGRVSYPKMRVVLPPLLRRAVVTPNLRQWMIQAQNKLSANSTPASAVQGIGSSLSHAASELGALSRQVLRLQSRELAHEQVTVFYRDWLTRLERTPQSVRSLALHQEFAAAQLTGRVAGELPRSHSPRDSSVLAQQFMLNCV